MCADFIGITLLQLCRPDLNFAKSYLFQYLLTILEPWAAFVSSSILHLRHMLEVLLLEALQAVRVGAVRETRLGWTRGMI